MKRFLTISFFALVLVIGATGAAPVAHAITCPAGQVEGTEDLVGQCFAKENSSTSVGGTLNTAGAQIPIPNKGTADDAYNGIMIKIMGLFAWLVGVAALTLDYAVYYTVVNMGSYVSHLTAIGVTWRILRDIGNIALIFGFLAIGITTILDVNWYGDRKKMLPMMLVAAVFLNFSLFFSEAIIDVGNLFATQFYTQINGGVTPKVNSSGFVLASDGSTLSPGNEGISNKLMAQLGLQTIYNVKDNNVLLTKSTPFYVGFMAILLFIVTAFVMFSLAFILIARFVFLVFLIILAPIGFAGLAVPQLKARATKWWGSLFEQTITAPVLLLLLYVALAVITDAQFLIPGSPTGFVENANLPGFGGYMMSFTIAIGLMFAVTISAKSLSAFGAGKATALAGKLTFGATAWGMNRTLGRGAYFAQRGLRQSKTFNKVNALTGRALTRGLDRVATGSFDVRGAAIGGGLKGLGVDAGAAQKGGFIEARKEGIKEHEEEVKRIETAHKEGFSERDERKAIANATAEAEGKDRAVKQVYGEVKPVLEKKIEQQRAAIAQHEQDVARLEAEEQRRTKFGGFSSPEDLRNLATARENLTTSKASLAANETSLGEATQKLSEAAKNLKKVTEEAQKTAGANALKANIKASKVAYAEGIDHPLNPITFVAYGPGGGAAARKIKESLKEKKNIVDLDEMKKFLEGKDKPKEEKLAEPAKPEAAH